MYGSGWSGINTLQVM